MILTIYKNKKQCECDNCGQGFECDSFAEAMEIMKEEGWAKRVEGENWSHYCPDCKKVRR